MIPTLDVRQRFTISTIWEEPYFKEGGLMHWIAGGWNLAPVITARTGTPFSVFDFTNSYGYLAPRVMFDQPFTPTYTQTSTGSPNQFNYLNLSSGAVDSSYVNPLAGVSDFGPYPNTMTGRNSFRTPGVWKFNMGVYKNFDVTEHVKLQTRVEAFDLLNHSNLYIVLRQSGRPAQCPVRRWSQQPVVFATTPLRTAYRHRMAESKTGTFSLR